jgi:uncharacterized coiled-coil DUF342 family protein
LSTADDDSRALQRELADLRYRCGSFERGMNAAVATLNGLRDRNDELMRALVDLRQQKGELETELRRTLQRLEQAVAAARIEGMREALNDPAKACAVVRRKDHPHALC